MESGCWAFFGVLYILFCLIVIPLLILFLSNVRCSKFALKCGWSVISQSLGMALLTLQKCLGKCARGLFSWSNLEMFPLPPRYSKVKMGRLAVGSRFQRSQTSWGRLDFLKRDHGPFTEYCLFNRLKGCIANPGRQACLHHLFDWLSIPSIFPLLIISHKPNPRCWSLLGTWWEWLSHT